MALVEKNRFGIIALQLQETITDGFALLEKYTDHKKEYKKLIKLYAKATALYSDLSHKYIDNSYKVKDEKILFYSISDFYKSFLRNVSHHCFQGVSQHYVDLYDRLLLGWESFVYDSRYLAEADKINNCWEIYAELSLCVEDMDEDAPQEHIDLVTDILEDWDWNLQMYTDMYNSEEAK